MIAGRPSFFWGCGFGRFGGGAGGCWVAVFWLRRRINWVQIETIETLDWSWPHAWFGSGVGAFVGALDWPAVVADRRRELVRWAALGFAAGSVFGLSQVLENGANSQ